MIGSLISASASQIGAHAIDLGLRACTALSLNPLISQADPLSGGGAAPAGPAAGGAASGATSGAAAGGAAGPAWISWAMMLGVFAVFYFLILRPQQKRSKEHKDFVDGLRVGAEIVTSGGIYGKVAALEDQIARIEIAPRVEIRVHKSHIAGASAKAAEALANQQK